VCELSEERIVVQALKSAADINMMGEGRVKRGWTDAPIPRLRQSLLTLSMAI
jgi:hypothetical protein